MAGRIRDEDVALVRERSKVDEVVGEYVTLKRAGGASLKGLCPFHDEKSTSFNVNAARGYWHCFGCGEGGDEPRHRERIFPASTTTPRDLDLQSVVAEL